VCTPVLSVDKLIAGEALAYAGMVNHHAGAAEVVALEKVIGRIIVVLRLNDDGTTTPVLTHGNADAVFAHFGPARVAAALRELHTRGAIFIRYEGQIHYNLLRWADIDPVVAAGGHRRRTGRATLGHAPAGSALRGGGVVVPAASGGSSLGHLVLPHSGRLPRSNRRLAGLLIVPCRCAGCRAIIAARRTPSHCAGVMADASSRRPRRRGADHTAGGECEGGLRGGGGGG